VQGKVTGYLALNERSSYLNKPEEYFGPSLKSGSHSWEASALQVQKADDKNQPWSFTSNVSGTSIVSSGDYIYLSPVFTTDFSENPFKAESRTFPIEFNYPYAYKLIMDVVVPQGYVIESLPSSKKLESEDGGISLTYRSGENAGKIQLIFDFSLMKVKYEHDQYLMLKQLFQEISTIAGEQIVLKKST
jgi:hypothetical protein